MNTEKDKQPYTDHLLRGVLSGLLAFALLSFMGAGVKILAQTHHVVEIAFYRNGIGAVPTFLYLLAFRKTHLFGTRKPALLSLRVLVGTGALFLTFSALKALPLADATVIFFTASLIAPALAFVFLKEHIGPRRWSAILIGLSGILLIARPSGDVTLVGVTLAFGAAVSHALVHLFLRSLKSEPPSTVTFYFLAGGALISALFLPFIANPPRPDEWLLFLGVGASGGLAQYFMTNAFRLASVATIMPLTYTGLIWSTGLDIFIWHYIPGWPVFAGGALIIGANLYVLHREKKRL